MIPVRLFITAFLLTATAVSVTSLEASEFADEVKRLLASKGPIAPEEDAPGAVDGKVTNYYSFHTGQDDPPWWQVDLGESKAVAHVRIYSPHVSERMTEFRLLASGDGYDWETVYVHGKATNDDKRFDIALPNVSTRYVRIAASSRTWMHLDEVMVFGPGPGEEKTNLALRRPCRQSSATHWSSRSASRSPQGDWRIEFGVARRVIDPILGRMGDSDDLAANRDKLIAGKVSLDDDRWETLYQAALARSGEWIDVRQQFELIDLAALARALDDLAGRYPERYPDAASLRGRLGKYREPFEALKADVAAGRSDAWAEAARLVEFQRDVLLRNPLLDFDRMVVLRRRLGGESRRAMGSTLGVGTLNSHTNDSLKRTGWDNTIAELSSLRTEPIVKDLHDTEGRIITDLEVDFDASRMMFSSIGLEQGNWRIFEMGLEGDDLDSTVQQITPDDGEDVGHFDSCYIGDREESIFTSTAPYQGLPCEYGSKRMTCLFKLNRRTGDIRQLTFEQDSDWSPTALHDGRVMYLRWEYTDLPHSNSRILFQMNPDGRVQREYYGSGSYFMPSYFYARPIPDHDTQVVGVATGHHGTPRSGRLIIVDPQLGRREAQGLCRRFPVGAKRWSRRCGTDWLISTGPISCIPIP